MRGVPQMLVVGALLLAGCDLNPQPLPPGDTPGDATATPGAGGSTGGDSADAGPTKFGDAGNPMPPVGDAGLDAMVPADAGLDGGDAGDAATDGGDAGDGGTSDGGGDGGDAEPQRT